MVENLFPRSSVDLMLLVRLLHLHQWIVLYDHASVDRPLVQQLASVSHYRTSWGNPRRFGQARGKETGSHVPRRAGLVERDDLIQFEGGLQISKLGTTNRERWINGRGKSGGLGCFAYPLGLLFAKTQRKPGLQRCSIRSRKEKSTFRESCALVVPSSSFRSSWVYEVYFQSVWLSTPSPRQRERGAEISRTFVHVCLRRW